MSEFDIRKSPLFAESWNVAWRKKPVGSILFDQKEPFIVIENSMRYWAADPFVYERNGKTYIFAELYDYVLRRGVIGYCELNESGKSKWIPIIKEPYHLSYPLIINYNDKIYIMPESSGGNELSLYEAIDFPKVWKKTKILRKSVKFADTTPLSNSNYAVTHDVTYPIDPKLKLIDLEGKELDFEIQVPTSLRSRPAGHVFTLNSENIRPVQVSLNYDEGYGKALVFNKYTFDSLKVYHEEELKEIYPKDLKYSRDIYLDGMHTYNSSDHFEVIDIKTRRFNFVNFIFRIMNKFI